LRNKRSRTGKIQAFSRKPPLCLVYKNGLMLVKYQDQINQHYRQLPIGGADLRNGGNGCLKGFGGFSAPVNFNF
jgi:hypothetical protein